MSLPNARARRPSHKAGRAGKEAGRGGKEADTRTSLLDRYAGKSSNDKAELATAKGYIQQLEDMNAVLKEKLDKLRKAQAPMTRLVREPTKFGGPQGPGRREPSTGRKDSRRDSRRGSHTPQVSKVLPKIGNPFSDSSAAELAALRKHVAVLEEEQHAQRSCWQEELEREQQAVTVKVAEVAELTGIIKGLKGQSAEQATIRELTQRQLQVLEQGMRQKMELAQKMMLIQLKASMIKEIERLRTSASEMASKYEEQTMLMSAKWKEREDEYRQLWDKREQDFKDILQKIRLNSKMTITRKVTLVSGEDSDDASPSVRQQVADMSEFPDMMKKLEASMSGWRGTSFSQEKMRRLNN